MKFKSVILCSLVAALFLAVALRRPVRTTASVNELPQLALTMTNGLLCRIGETKPFTGWMFETNLHGGYLSRSFLSNGLLEGESIGYHTNGQRQVLEHFRAGVSHGPRVKWHSNGAKASEATIENGKIEGLFVRWSEEGHRTEEVSMKNGQPDGISRSFFPSGSVKTEVSTRDGQVVAQQSFQDGERPAVGKK